MMLSKKANTIKEKIWEELCNGRAVGALLQPWGNYS